MPFAAPFAKALHGTQIVIIARQHVTPNQFKNCTDATATPGADRSFGPSYLASDSISFVLD
jgi:hypothetical protein